MTIEGMKGVSFPSKMTYKRMLLRSPPPGHFYLYRKQVKVKRTKIKYTDVFRHHHLDDDDEREQTFENQNGFLIG